MIDNVKVDESIIISETSLAYIPRNKFSLHTWFIFDEFMDYATDVFAATFASLIKNEYIRIEEKKTKLSKFLGIEVSKNTTHVVKLVKQPSDKFIKGWLESIIFEQFRHSNYNELEIIIYKALNEVFDKKNNLTNPGKLFTLKILENQKLNLYHFEHRKNWISERVSIKYNDNTSNYTKPIVFRLNDFTSLQININTLREIVSSNFKKFQDLG